MAPSQLKQLKKSLRDNGLMGQQWSKKKKGRSGARQGPTARDEATKAAALADIRERARPFDVQISRPQKFEVTTTKSMREQKAGGKPKLEISGRPAVSRSRGEELRRKTLLKDLQSRSKAGGILDRRIGEYNTQMTDEERLQRRLIKEASRRSKGKASLFDLENEDEDGNDGFLLTHQGKEIDFDDLGSDISGDEENTNPSLKRRYGGPDDDENDGDDGGTTSQPERKKTKAEVMKEVIAKSKYHKMERRMAQEEDAVMLEELNKKMPDILSELTGLKNIPAPEPLTARSTNPLPRNAFAPLSTDAGGDGDRDGENGPESKTKSYDLAVRELAKEKRAQPTERTKTAEELQEEYDAKMAEMEAARERRMRGEEVGVGNIDEMAVDEDVYSDDGDDKSMPDEEDGDAATFGFRQSKLGPRLDEEDEFLLDEDIVASEDEEGEWSLEDGSGSEIEVDSDDDATFTAGFDDDTIGSGKGQDGQGSEAGPWSGIMNGKDEADEEGSSSDDGLDEDDGALIRCPQTHEDLLALLEGSDVAQLSQTIRLIRATHARKRRVRLGAFAGVLVKHLHHLGSSCGISGVGENKKDGKATLRAVDEVMRHIQSMSRTFPLEIAVAFRDLLDQMMTAHSDGSTEPRPGSVGGLTSGDLLILTAVGTVFSTSDHFHPVAMPALTISTRWLSLHTPARTAAEAAVGTFLVLTTNRYVSRSGRYIPESIRFIDAVTSADRGGWLFGAALSSNKAEDRALAAGLATTLAQEAGRMGDLWARQSAFISLATPLLDATKRIASRFGSIDASTAATGRRMSDRLQIQLSRAASERRSVTLHFHRPRAIRTLIPRFEDSFDPERKHQRGADDAKSESQKLRALHKKEMKGAIRELRKDSAFVAREKLKEKKIVDDAYHAKMRKLVADIQSESGGGGH